MVGHCETNSWLGKQWVLKDYAHLLAPPVTSFNLQKKADVMHVPNNKAPSDITKDLRRVSLTATLSETCERFVADWLMELIRGKIDKRQFGSLKNSTTTHALLSLVRHLLNENAVSKNAVTIFYWTSPKLLIILIITSSSVNYLMWTFHQS
jgi:hypothetical protein